MWQAWRWSLCGKGEASGEFVDETENTVQIEAAGMSPFGIWHIRLGMLAS